MRISIILVITIFLGLLTAAQDNVPGDRLVERFIKATKIKSESLYKKTLKQYQKAIKNGIFAETTLKDILSKKDSVEGNRVFGNAEDVYAKWRRDDFLNSSLSANRIDKTPYFDSISSSIAYFQQLAVKFENKIGAHELQQLLNRYNDLELLLNRTAKLQQFMKERRAYLKQQLSKWDLGKFMNRFDKTIYYFGQIVDDYKTIINQKSAVERKVLSIIRENGDFRNLLHQRVSLLPKIKLPHSGSKNLEAAHSGLQTRAFVQKKIMKMPIDSVAPEVFLKRQVEEEGLLQKNNQVVPQLRQAVMKYLGELPSFNVNKQKGKGFVRRLEAGINLQFGRMIKTLPTSGELAFSLGYKVNDKSTIGLAASYRVGVSGTIKKLHINNQGIGIRSFIDWKIKGNFYVTGGYERNFLPEVNNTTIINDIRINEWQNSALIGAMKKYSLGKRKVAIQILLDILSINKQGFRTPVLVRNAFYF